MSLELLLLFLGGSLLAGVLGRNRRIGFWGFVFASMVFTPVVTLSFLYFAAPVALARRAGAAGKYAK